MPERKIGLFKWLNSAKGCCFIEVDGGKDVIVHFSEISATGYLSLEEGQNVEFNIVDGQKGPQAQKVVLS